jgi:cell division protein FtsB
MHILHLNPMEVIDQIVSEKPSWYDKKSIEEVLRNDIANLRTQNGELKSENVILRNQIEKLLQKPCCRE